MNITAVFFTSLLSLNAVGHGPLVQTTLSPLLPVIISGLAADMPKDAPLLIAGRTHTISDLTRINWDDVMPGDTLLLTEPRYNQTLRIEKSGTADAPIVIRSATSTVISAEGVRPHAMETSGAQTDLTFQNITFERGGAAKKADGTVQISPGSHRLRFEDCQANGGAANGFFGEGSGADDLQLVRCRAEGNALRGAVAPGRARSGFLAEDCTFAYNRGDGLLINSSNGKVQACRFVGNGMIDEDTPVEGGEPKHAIYMYPYQGGAEDWIIEDCVMSNNRGSGGRIAGRNTIYRRNTVLNSPVFVYVVRNEGINDGHAIVGNTFGAIDQQTEYGKPNFGPGIQIEGGFDVRVEDNDLTGGGVSVAVQEERRTKDGVILVSRTDSKNVVVRNNRITLTLDDRFVGTEAEQSEGFVSENNTFFSSGEATDLRWRYEGGGYGLEPWKRLVNDPSSVFLSVDPVISHLPVADVFVRGGTYQHEHYGDLDQLAVKDATTDYDRLSFLRFDVSSGGGGDSTTLVLRVTALGGEGVSERPLELRAVSSDDWSETQTTGANQPPVGDLLGTLIVTEANLNQDIYWDITDYVQAERQRDGLASVAIVQPTNTRAYIRFGSRESATPPSLRVRPKIEKRQSVATHNTYRKSSPMLTVYPNPTSGLLRLQLPSPDGQLTVLDAQARVVVPPHPVRATTVLDLSQQPPGVYFLRVQTRERTYQRSAIIHR